MTRPLVSASESPLYFVVSILENTLGLTSFSRWNLDLLNAFCESYTTRLIVFEWVWQVVFDSLFLYSWEWYNELSLTLTAWQALMDTACTDRPTGRRLRSYFTNCCGNLDVCFKSMLLSILETKVDLQLWSDASLSVQRAKSEGSNTRDLPWISDQRVRGWASSLHENELFHQLLGILGPMSLNRHS